MSWRNFNARMRNTAKRAMQCECHDSGCPVHPGSAACNKPKGRTVLYRVDTEDRTGSVLCDGCSADAINSGLFRAIEEEER